MKFADFLIDFGSESEFKFPKRFSSLERLEEKGEQGRFYLDFQNKGELYQSYDLEEGDKLWVLGELYGESKPSLEDLKHWNAEGSSRPPFENGHFLIILRKAKENEWHVWTDRFGTFHAYYTLTESGGAIGSFFQAVAMASQKELDWEGITGFLGFGFFPQDRTYFKDVRIFRPAHHYVFGSSGALKKSERYWDWVYQPDGNRSYEQTLKEFDEVLRQVLADQTSEFLKTAVPISGGLDSRTTVAALPLNREFWSYSYGYSRDSIETEIAQKVASARKLPFERFAITPYFFKKIKSIVSSIEGFQNLTLSRQASIVESLDQNAQGGVIAAHWGDVWLDTTLSQESPPLSAKAIEDLIFRKFCRKERSWLLENVCRKNLEGRDPEQVLRNMIREDFKYYESLQDADFCMKAFKTDQWSFRWTLASLRMFQVGAFPKLPFYDNRVVDFLLTVPMEFHRGRKFQIDYLKRYAPDLAKIKWQVYDTNLFWYSHFNTWLLPKRILKKVFRVLTQKKTFEENWEVQLLAPTEKRLLDSWLLDKGQKLHRWISRDALKALLDSFDGQSRLEGYTVSMLLTLSVCLEEFFKEQPLNLKS